MNEIFDKLLLRGALTILLCLLLYLYKYAHHVLYPTVRNQMFKTFSPEKNPVDSLHFFSRIIGIGIICSSFHFDIGNGVTPAIIHLCIMSIISFILYLSSLYIFESIVLYNFEYNDEVNKRKNTCYGVISFAIAISVSIILRSIISEIPMSQDNIIVILIFMWLLGMSLLGVSTKAFPFISKLSFNKLMIQKDVTLALSYSGFIFGAALIISSAFHVEATGIQNYVGLFIIDIILSAIILPIFIKGLNKVFNLVSLKNEDAFNINWGYGLYEGIIFLTACFLTTVVTGHIQFGQFYPIY